MKRHNNLWDRLTSFENLLLAAKKAQKRKRRKGSVLRFNHRLESELLQLQEELRAFAYEPGEPHVFTIYEPKERLISAAPYRDRVVHHAVVNVIEPLFEPTFIGDSYANRRGKGTHAAVDRFQQYLRSRRYGLKCDIVKFFPSIDHELLKERLRRKLKCRGTLWLLDRIIDSTLDQHGPDHFFPGDSLFTPLERRRGLPIGNLTSQFFGNLYLNGFDHLVKEQLGVRGYVRYVDDFTLFGDDKRELWQKFELAVEHLDRLRLKAHPTKTRLFQTREGAEFLGYRVYPNRRRLRRDNPRRYGRRLKQLARAYARGEVDPADVRRSLAAWQGHARHACTERLRREVFRGMVFRRNTALGNGSDRR